MRRNMASADLLSELTLGEPRGGPHTVNQAGDIDLSFGLFVFGDAFGTASKAETIVRKVANGCQEGPGAGRAQRMATWRRP